MLLEVKNLHVHYGVIHAIKGVSFNVEEGKIVTLIGSNGAGKTTILKTISQILNQTEGEILFLGNSMSDYQPHQIVKMGISQVPEGRRVFPDLTVLENLQMGAYYRKDKEAIAKDLETVYMRFPRLKERTNQTAGTLSGGEQQMLAMGRALMSHPKILLLDEPSMGLAPILVDEIFSIIDDIHRAGTTILLVEQNANRALHVSDYGYVLETGKIIAQGKATDLLNDEKVKEAYLSA
ncbi:ABC transporter ATP-binding protein [Candidatus Xianfuyuplasma coldseepsis]|uniref:ABC transporter ATP-binding protein n=1 Tax=Candidatus Xianfuyuplasma coldseepsis TaxID=2782163 RepID=A0A7L7KQL7_9MOLU|nr:ABC transporter ATP-binding protein [Xianfuyuplasma coldseepsis]QMS84729.1 ABC transporter ATP-binding protein [Xianfuyuplasma coldseepsis]